MINHKLKSIFYLLACISNSSYAYETNLPVSLSSKDFLIEIFCEISSNDINQVPIASKSEVSNKINSAPWIRFKTNSTKSFISIDNIENNNINIDGIEFIDKDGKPMRLFLDIDHLIEPPQTLGKIGDKLKLPEVPKLANRKASDNSFRPIFIKGDNGLFIDDHKTGQFAATADITINCGRE